MCRGRRSEVRNTNPKRKRGRRVPLLGASQAVIGSFDGHCSCGAVAHGGGNPLECPCSRFGLVCGDAEWRTAHGVCLLRGPPFSIPPSRLYLGDDRPPSKILDQACTVCRRLAAGGPGRGGSGPMGRLGSQQPVRAVGGRPTRSGRQRRSGPTGTSEDAAGRPSMGRGRRNPPPTAGDFGRKAAGGRPAEVYRAGRLVPVAVGRAAVRGAAALSRPRRSRRQAMVRAGCRPARPPLAPESRRSGVCQQLRRPRPDGSGRHGVGVGRLRRGAVELGADRA